MSLQTGIDLFENGHFFEAHDAWEEVWQEMSGRERIFWQAMIQVAVSLYHSEGNNWSGAMSQARKSASKLQQIGLIQNEQVRQQLIQLVEKWIFALESGDESGVSAARFALQNTLPSILRTGFFHST